MLSRQFYMCDQCAKEIEINTVDMEEDEYYPRDWWKVSFEKEIETEFDFCSDECLIAWLKTKTNSSTFKV